MARAKKVKVVYRKLGKEQADGRVFMHSRVIEIDERLEGKGHFAALLHELLHLELPHMEEPFIEKMEQNIVKVMMREGVWTKK